MQESIALLIPVVLIRVLAAVDFDDEASIQAREVSYVDPDRNLSPESMTIDVTAAQKEPQA
ncbi:MAG TPA: hypothetical protein VIT67_13350 [Povalibacter sp.]